MEKWVPIKGFEGYYEVSDRGRIKSLPRDARVSGGGIRRTRERIMRASPNGKPGREYLYVGLRLPGQVPVKKSVHAAVLEAFVGPCPPGMEACHNNGDSQNNRLDNLRWDTSENNNADKLRHGRRRGRKPGGPVCSKGHLRECVGVNDLGEPLWLCRVCKLERDNAQRRDREPTPEQQQHTLDYQREYQREYYRRNRKRLAARKREQRSEVKLYTGEAHA
jgi:hypothetical protein